MYGLMHARITAVTMICLKLTPNPQFIISTINETSKTPFCSRQCVDEDGCVYNLCLLLVSLH